MSTSVSVNQSMIHPSSGDGAAEARMREVAALMVSALNLEIAPEDIQADAPLSAEGLGLDSIDILELAMVVSKHYNLQLRADHEDSVRIFGSLRSLAEYIEAQKTK